MTTKIDWLDEFSRFFAWCQPRLPEVLDAGGAREVWLQGEAYRYFRKHRPAGPLCLYANCHDRNDLAFYATDDAETPIALAEIKLFGLDYYPKNLTGYADLRPYVAPPRGRFVFEPTHAARCHPKESSILKDYRKLLRATDGRRFMLLVLDTRAPASEFGTAIQNVDFGRRGVVVHDHAPVKVTCWEVR
jgi:hypothetical protein